MNEDTGQEWAHQQELEHELSELESENEHDNIDIGRIRNRKNGKSAQHESSGNPAFAGGEKAAAIPF